MGDGHAEASSSEPHSAPTARLLASPSFIAGPLAGRVSDVPAQDEDDDDPLPAQPLSLADADESWYGRVSLGRWRNSCMTRFGSLSPACSLGSYSGACRTCLSAPRYRAVFSVSALTRTANRDGGSLGGP